MRRAACLAGRTEASPSGRDHGLELVPIGAQGLGGLTVTPVRSRLGPPVGRPCGGHPRGGAGRRASGRWPRSPAWPGPRGRTAGRRGRRRSGRDGPPGCCPGGAGPAACRRRARRPAARRWRHRSGPRCGRSARRRPWAASGSGSPSRRAPGRVRTAETGSRRAFRARNVRPGAVHRRAAGHASAARRTGGVRHRLAGGARPRRRRVRSAHQQPRGAVLERRVGPRQARSAR